MDEHETFATFGLVFLSCVAKCDALPKNYLGDVICVQLKSGCDAYIIFNFGVLNSFLDIYVEMPDFPYPTDSNDHCETPEQAYRDVVSILKRISKKIAKVKKSKKLKIYDPYYCNGGVIDKLSLLGYPKVHNEKVDCYSVWESGNLPDFDVLVTNPPYSGDHIEKLIKFLSSKKFGNKPWMLLCPEFVHKKDYYTELMTKKKRPLYIVPNKRYIYLPPRGFREKKASATHKKSSPFTSYWYIWGGSNEMTDMLAEFFQQHGGNDCKTARSKNELRELRRKNRKKQTI